MIASFAATVFLALLACAFQVHETLSAPRLRFLIPVLCLVLLTSLRSGGKNIALIWQRPVLGFSIVLGSVAVALAPIVLDGGPERVGRSIVALGTVVVGWCVVMWLPLSAKQSPTSGNPGKPVTYWAVVALVAGTAVVLAGAHHFAGSKVVSPDEVGYLLQGRLMTEPGYVRQLDESLRPFFALRQTVFSEGRLYTQFPPGWPTLVALFSGIGLTWWSGVIMATLGLFFSCLVAEHLGSRAHAVRLGVLLAASYPFLSAGSGYLSHGSALAMTAGATFLMVWGQSLDLRWRAPAWSIAGAFLGAAIAIRPLTGACLSASLFGWMLIRERLSPRRLIVLGACVAVGAAGPIFWLLKYNAATNGDPFTLGYVAANGPLHDLGFGPRGWMSLGEDGSPLEVLRVFTPGKALSHFAHVLLQFNTLVIPAFLIGPLFLISRYYGYRVRWWTILPFLVLPTVQFFYFINGIRFYIELLPFVYFGVAAMLVQIHGKNRQAGRMLLTFVVTSNIAVSTVMLYADYQGTRERRLPYFERVQEALRTHDKVLVFVKEPVMDENILELLSIYNVQSFPGNVVVARDRGSDNRILMRLLPSHFPIRIVRDSWMR